VLALCFIVAAVFAARADEPAATQGWSEQQIDKLPEREEAVRLFNGKDFTGWDGQIGKYFFIEHGVIVARNDKTNAPKAST
jgi:hypothetical protein